MKPSRFLFGNILLVGACLLGLSAKMPKTERQNIVQGDAQFTQENYEVALTYYIEAFKIDPSNANLCFKIGVCYMNIPNKKSEAEKYLFVAANDASENYKETSVKERHAPTSAYYLYAQSLHLAGKFDDAISYFEKYKLNVDPNDSTSINDIMLRERWCINGKTLIQSPVNFKSLARFFNIRHGTGPYSKYASICFALQEYS